MNRTLWLHYNSTLPCPNCEYGILDVTIKDTITETYESKVNNEFHKNGIVYPETNFIGTSHMKCSNCEEIVIMAYEKTEDVRHTDDLGNEIPFINPIFYYPAPPIIKLPSSCTTDLKTLLKASFSLYWVDLGSCANKIRTAIECLMDFVNIPNDKNLHNRIVEFQQINPKVGNYLLAIKWIGNSGSHHSSINKEAILDAYQLLEYSLELIFNDREKNLDEISAKINTNKKHV